MRHQIGRPVVPLATGLFVISFLLGGCSGGADKKSASPVAEPPSAARTDELILCGWDEVFILGIDRTGQRPPEKVWSWTAEGCPDLPDSMKPRFSTTDECKPVEGGAKVLITSSSDGVALVERSSGRVLFYGTAHNAHSAEPLPGRRLAVAASHRPGGSGDRLIVFDLDTHGKELTSAELPWGHGVVWDEDRQVLWALSGKDLREFRLRDWDTGSPGLEPAGRTDLPGDGGHDLQPVPGTGLLAVSTDRHCWLFDRESRRFTPHPDLADQARVKSISLDRSTGRLAWVQAEGDDWWAERVHFLHPGHTLHLPGQHLYKARWNVR
ncbi:MAG: hypothetical protein JXQ83_03335 [Candidatus Glassbacteria bacterium]|nr:hypothetical protein [Candidatus Glassbacteria bacterium]